MCVDTRVVGRPLFATKLAALFALPRTYLHVKLVHDENVADVALHTHEIQTSKLAYYEKQLLRSFLNFTRDTELDSNQFVLLVLGCSETKQAAT